jgi:SAM-dependent MidA family methyltransferase
MSPASGSALGAEVRRQLKERGGKLPFDEFLELVLYNPTLGYYRRKNIFGRGGDYQTAPRVHPIFGWTVARVIEKEWVDQCKPVDFTLLELGPGEGHLIRSVTDYLVNERSLDLDGWKILLMDRFPKEEAFQPLAGGCKPEWVTSIRDMQPFRGVVLANELLDAIPFHRLVMSGGRWKELYVGTEHGNGKLTWVEGPLSVTGLTIGLRKDVPEKTVIEVTTGFHSLMKDLSGVLAEGSVLFFDYGDTRENLLSRHPGGTLETFRQHSAGADPFQDLGSRDITAWVDFTRVMDEAKKSGFEIEEFYTQAEAMYRWGIQEVVAETAKKGEVERVKAHLASKTFLFSYSNHQVLKLRRLRRARAAPLRSLIR